MNYMAKKGSGSSAVLNAYSSRLVKQDGKALATNLFGTAEWRRTNLNCYIGSDDRWLDLDFTIDLKKGSVVRARIGQKKITGRVGIDDLVVSFREHPDYRVKRVSFLLRYLPENEYRFVDLRCVIDACNLVANVTEADPENRNLFLIYFRDWFEN